MHEECAAPCCKDCFSTVYFETVRRWYKTRHYHQLVLSYLRAMTTDRVAQRKFTGLTAHGLVGLAIILAAEVLLFSGNQLVGRWFTPIAWTGYILFVDAIVHKLESRSLLATDRVELLIIAITSIAGWWLFEFYNAPRFWQSNLELWWHYHNLEPNLFLRRFGYDWAFATIFPALFETAELLRATVFHSMKPAQAIKLPRSVLYAMIITGAIGAALPLIIVSRWLVPLVWLSYIFLLDPINCLRGLPSLTNDLAQGDLRRLVSLLASGVVCGLLWEFWNYWALTKWTYTVPYLGNVKIFEMPVLGYLGFPPFAIECWAMYIFARGWILGAKDWGDSLYPTL
jgi:hypothetical protein